MKILRSGLAIIRVIILVVLMVVFLSVYAFSLLFSKHTPQRGFRLRRNYIRAAIKIFNIQLDSLEGRMHDKPALYVSNHRSFMDPVIACCFVDAVVIAKAEVASMPVLSWGAKVTGIIYVDRDNKSSRESTRQLMIDTIKSGQNVLVYPEGTVGSEKGTIAFKPGSFLACAKEGFPVVPLANEYKYEYSYWKVFSLVKHFLDHAGRWQIPTKFKIGPAMTDQDGIELKDRAQSWIDEELAKMQEGWSEVFK